MTVSASCPCMHANEEITKSFLPARKRSLFTNYQKYVVFMISHKVLKFQTSLISKGSFTFLLARVIMELNSRNIILCPIALQQLQFKIISLEFAMRIHNVDIILGSLPNPTSIVRQSPNNSIQVVFLFTEYLPGLESAVCKRVNNQAKRAKFILLSFTNQQIPMAPCFQTWKFVPNISFGESTGMVEISMWESCQHLYQQTKHKCSDPVNMNFQ